MATYCMCTRVCVYVCCICVTFFMRLCQRVTT